jgi:hypothetical protein
MKKINGILATVWTMFLAMFVSARQYLWPRFHEGQVIATLEDLKEAIKSGWKFTGTVTMEHWRSGKLLHTETGTNTFTTEGMAKLLNIMFHDISKAASHIWYVGIFKNNITPALADTGAKLGSGNAYGECQDADYDNPLTNRPAYTTEDTTTAVITNVNAKAHFVMNASITVYGAFLVDTAAKTSAAGTLMCAKRFGTPRAVIADDEIYVTYQITCTTS